MLVDPFDNNYKNNDLYLKNHSFSTFEKNIVFITNNNKLQNLKNYKNINTLYEINETDFLICTNTNEYINEYKKFFITKFHISFFHFFIDTLSTIIDIVQNVDKPFFIIDCISTIPENYGWELKKYERTYKDKIFYINLVAKYLTDNNIKYVLLNKDFTIKINNCYFVDKIEPSNKTFNEINKIINIYQNNITKKPFKKVYLSKRVSNNEEDNNYSFDDFTNEEIIRLRIMNEHVLEKYLSNNGFEIIDVETKFESMEDQIDYFSNVKTLCSVTQAGLVNSLFMKPGGNIIEFVSPMSGNNKQYALHSYEHMNIAYSQGHTYVGIKNLFDANILVNNIDQNQFLNLIFKENHDKNSA